MLGARFRPDVHNQRRLQEHRGNTSVETLDRFRAVIGLSVPYRLRGPVRPTTVMPQTG